MYFKGLLVLSALVSADKTQIGDCVLGVDPIGQDQHCLGRCHIYYEGDIGACGHQVTQEDVSGACGSAANPCLSTFNVDWDDSKGNCGNCYHVQMTYDDGTVTETYIKTEDTNASETKFEMGQLAWRNICPYVCLGTGVCAYSPDQCTYGIINGDENISCAVQYAPITFRRVECGSNESSPTSAPSNPTTAIPATGLLLSTTTTATVLPTTASTTPTTASTTPTTASTTPTTASTTPTTATLQLPITEAPVTTTHVNSLPAGSNSGDSASICKTLIYSSESAWTEQCKLLCDYYSLSENALHCPAQNTGGLLACVKQFAPYCNY